MVLCRDDTSRESCMQTYILILWPHNEAHIWPCRRVGDLCSMVQQRPKLEMVAWLTTFCQVKSDISLQWRGCEDVSKKGISSEQFIRPPRFWEFSLQEWWWYGRVQATYSGEPQVVLYMWSTTSNKSAKSVGNSVAFQETVIYSPFSISWNIINKTNACLISAPGSHKSVWSGKCLDVTPKQMQHPTPDSAENTNQCKSPPEQ